MSNRKDGWVFPLTLKMYSYASQFPNKRHWSLTPRLLERKFFDNGTDDNPTSSMLKGGWPVSERAETMGKSGSHTNI